MTSPSESVADVATPTLAPCLVAALDAAAFAVAVFTLDDAPVGSSIVYVNDAHLELSGYMREELLGHSSLLLAGALPDVRHVRELAGAPAAEPFFARTRKHRPDGAPYDVEIQIRPLRAGGDGGPITHRVLTQRDVAAHDPGARSLPDASRLAAERVLSMGQVAAGAAYELETPLAQVVLGVRGALDALAGDGPSRVTAALRGALAGAERAAAAVRGLRAFTRSDGDRRAPGDPHEAIDVALRLARGSLDARARRVLRLEPVPPVALECATLARVLLAVLRNAVEAIPPGMPHANEVAIHTRVLDGGRVAIDIRDTGAGIDAADVPHVFDPFFTTRAHAGSIGLGLTAARHAVLAAGGDFTLESTSGRGTRVRITLPQAPGAREREEAMGAPFTVHDVSPARRVLCVHASLAGAQRLAEVLDDGASNVTHASFSEALEALALGETFDLVAVEAESPRAEGFRAELRHLAPSMLERTFALSSRPHRAEALARIVGTNDAARSLGARAGLAQPEAQGERRSGAPEMELQPAVRPERENRSSRARRAGP